MEGSPGPARATYTIVERIAAYGASAALASGVLSLIATVFLLAFFVLEAPAVYESGASDVWVPLGRTNDAFIGLTALAMIPVAFRLHASWRARSSGASVAVVLIAVLSMLVAGATQLAFAANLIGSTTQSVLIGPTLAGIGAWMAAASLGRADPFLSGPLRWIGVAGGIALILILVPTFGVGAVGDPEAARRALQDPLIVGPIVLSLLGTNIAYPIWAIWLGRRWRAGSGGA